MRSTTFAILGITTATCLGLVAIVAQQGFPVLPGLPLPGVAAEQGGHVHGAKALVTPRPSPSLGAATEAPAAGVAAGRGGEPRRSSSSGSSGVSGSRQLATVQEPVPAAPADDGASGEEAPVTPVAVALPPNKATVTATEPGTAPAAPVGGGPPTGKGTATVDPPDRDDGEESPPVPAPEKDPDDADVEDVDADEVEAPPSQAETDEARARGGRGHGHRRFGR